MQGHNYNVNGQEHYSLQDILSLLEESVGAVKGHTSKQSSFGISSIIEEFFVGIAHDKNMANMAKFYDKNREHHADNGPDFFK